MQKLNVVLTIAASLAMAAQGALTIGENTVLPGDTDWTGQGPVTIASGVTLDLAGHSLKLDQLVGAGTIMTSVSVAELPRRNGYDITTADASRASADPDNAIFNNADMRAANLFSGNSTWQGDNVHRALIKTASLPAGIVYDFGAGTPQRVDTYRITIGTPTTTRAPKSWKFYGQLDVGGEWVELDSRDNESGWSSYTARTYDFANQTAYRKYRIVFTADNGGGFVELLKIEMGCRNPACRVAFNPVGSDLGALTIADGVNLGIGDLTLASDLDLTANGFSGLPILGRIDLNGHELKVDSLKGDGTVTDSHVFDLTDTDNTRVSSANVFNNTSAVAWKLFQNYAAYNADHRMLAPIQGGANLPVVIDYDFRVATVVDTVSVVNNDAPSAVARSPLSMRFYGRLDGSDEWVQLFENPFVRFAMQNENRIFGFLNATGYRYYRLELSAPTSQEFIELFKLEYGRIGKLRMTVPNGVTEINNSVTITGRVRLVKDGAGTFRAERANDYLGGTHVLAGTLEAPMPPANDTAAKAVTSLSPFGPDRSRIVVHQGGTFDVLGEYDYWHYDISLDGGTVKNSRAMSKTDWGGLAIGSLTADSTLKITANLVYNTIPTRLDGHTLTVDMEPGTYWQVETPLENGRIVVPRVAWLKPSAELDMRTVDLDFAGAFELNYDLWVRDYIANCGTSWNAGTNLMHVCGTFYPNSARFRGVTMEDGSAIDISGKSETWSVTSSPFANDSSGKSWVDFAEGATVAVKLGSRPVRGRMKLIDWTNHAPDGSVAFTVVGDNLKGTYLERLEDGLYIVRPGMVILVR